MSEQKNLYFNYKNTSSYYAINGTGEPIVFLHGFGLNSQIWMHQVEALSNSYTCILIDLPGFGKSTINEQDYTYNDSKNLDFISFYADWLSAFLAFLNLKNYTIVAHSLGGYITLEFAATNISDLKGLVLIHSSCFADDDFKKTSRRKTIDFIRKYGAKKFITYTTPHLISTQTKLNSVNNLSILKSTQVSANDDACIHYTNAMMNRKNNSNVLLQLNIDVCIIAGKEDNITPLSEVIQQVYLPKCCYFHVLLNVAHLGMQEQPNTVNKILLQYINR